MAATGFNSRKERNQRKTLLGKVVQSFISSATPAQAPGQGFMPSAPGKPRPQSPRRWSPPAPFRHGDCFWALSDNGPLSDFPLEASPLRASPLHNAGIMQTWAGWFVVHRGLVAIAGRDPERENHFPVIAF